MTRATDVVASTLMLWLATATASIAFWPVYESPSYVLLVGITTVVGSGIAILGTLVRWPAHLVCGAALIAFVVLGVPLAVPSAAAFGVLPTPEGLVGLAVGSTLGWRQLLTITLPVGSFESLLVPAFIVVLITVTASLSIALRARVAELATLGPAVLFITGIAFGPTNESFPVSVALVLTATLLIWIVWFRVRRRSLAVASMHTVASPTGIERGRSLRSAASALVLITFASGGAFAAITALPPSEPRTVLRSDVVQPFDPRDYASPLSGFRRYLQPERADSTMLTVDGLAEGDRIRIATLDTYDGVVYAVGSEAVSSASGSFTLVPSRFDQSATEGREVSLDVTVGAYSGVWVPTVGQLTSIDFAGPEAPALRRSFYYNDVSGSGAAIAMLSAGDSYRLDAVLPEQPSAARLAQLEPGDAPVPTPAVVPDELTVVLNRYVDGSEGDGARLVAAIEGLRAEGYISHGVSEDEPVSRSGHSADRITQLLTSPLMIGDGEQYAVAAALMARELGFPARVVVGFAPEVATTGPTVVTGADISAWIEVDTASSGWVTIDPVPPEREIPEAVPEEPTQVARPQQPVQPPLEEPEVREEQAPSETVQDDPDTVDPLLAALLVAVAIVGWIAVAAAIVSAPFIGIVAAKARRRRLRRRAGTPLDRIRGGWDEFEDTALDHGYRIDSGATRTEFAGRVGGSQPLVLAAAVDRAVFAPDTSENVEADRVWDTVGEVRSSLKKGLTRWQRIAALGSVQSIRRRPSDPRDARGKERARGGERSRGSGRGDGRSDGGPR